MMMSMMQLIMLIVDFVVVDTILVAVVNDKNGDNFKFLMVAFADDCLGCYV